MGELFGTDGVRGEVNQFLTAEMAFKLGKAGAYYLTQDCSEAKILVGKDTRVSGDLLEAALIAGISSLGVDVIKVGVVPTPAVAYLTAQEDVVAGIMISASHNPVQDNGIKFFNQDGFKLTDQQEGEIEELYFNRVDQLPLAAGDQVGQVTEGYQLVNSYLNHLKGTVNSDLSNLKIVVDCANGAAYQLTPQILSELGAEVIAINDQPTGFNINRDCGSTYPEVIKEAVINHQADLGIAHDGDADRLIAVDGAGKLVDGDYILTICGRYLLDQGELARNTIVVTKYSNLGLHQAIKEENGQVEVTKNGDRYVLAKMREKGYNLGGEKSGHIIFADYNTTGDGLLTALQLIEVIVESGKPLAELREQMTAFPQLLVNVEVESKDWEENQKISKAITEAEEVLGTDGRIFVRASGTEPVIRVMVEGQDKDELERLADQVAEVIEEELN
ncbi:phosphoglucosamine mutase [Natroniella sulfidigena]|uniref:phosphoglucosamine mutase n=1 Tax=Natroniella sulfidigena TaxID=723921 RepID=UPI00200AD3AF|nr:phosphoglucosamine mutase [Natroniella sulfidigena]MCK8816149.1 phosphoglucosamine mutase [Natroniella sulfidigena]